MVLLFSVIMIGVLYQYINYYDTYSLISDLSKLIEDRQLKLLVLDRYDMYCNWAKDVLIENKDNMIILIDCKQSTTFNEYIEDCVIELTNDSLEVKDEGHVGLLVVMDR